MGLTLEQIRARVQAEIVKPFNPASYEKFYLSKLETDVYWGELSPSALARFANITQYYPSYHENIKLRGERMSDDKLDADNRLKLLLAEGVYTEDGQRLDAETIKFLMAKDDTGDTKRLQDLIHAKSFINEKTSDEGAKAEEYVVAQTHIDAAFFDLLISCGALRKLVMLATADDTATPEMRADAEELLRYEMFAPEWSRQLQAREKMREMMAAIAAAKGQDEGNEVED